MKIFVTPQSGERIALKVESNDTIEDVKTKIQKENGTPPERQCLIFARQQLREALTVGDYNIKKESTLHLVELRGRDGAVTGADFTALCEALKSAGVSYKDMASALGYKSGRQENLKSVASGNSTKARDLEAAYYTLAAIRPATAVASRPSVATATPSSRRDAASGPDGRREIAHPPGINTPDDAPTARGDSASDGPLKKVEALPIPPASAAAPEPPSGAASTVASGGVSILYWNHGGSDCAGLKRVGFLGKRSQIVKGEYMFDKFVIGKNVDVLVVAEMKAANARKLVESQGFTIVGTQTKEQLDQVFIAVRKGFEAPVNPVTAGSRHVAVDIGQLRVFGVHLLYNATSEEKQACFDEVVDPSTSWTSNSIVVGDFNKKLSAFVGRDGPTRCWQTTCGDLIDNALFVKDTMAVSATVLMARADPDNFLEAKTTPHDVLRFDVSAPAVGEAVSATGAVRLRTPPPASVPTSGDHASTKDR